MNDTTLYADYGVRECRYESDYTEHFPISEDIGTQIIEYGEEIKVHQEEEAWDRIFKIGKNVPIEKRIKKIESNRDYDKQNDEGNNDVIKRLEPVAPNKLTPTVSSLNQESGPGENESGQEGIENFYPIINKCIRHIHHLIVYELVIGISISSFLSLFSHIASFIALSAVGGLLGGTVICESVLHNLRLGQGDSA